MLHSFLLNIAKGLDESAMVNGCTRLQVLRGASYVCGRSCGICDGIVVYTDIIFPSGGFYPIGQRVQLRDSAACGSVLIILGQHPQSKTSMAIIKI